AITPAFAQARSEGSWSDGLRVSATIESRPAMITTPIQRSGDDWIVEIEGLSPDDLTTGDLLRLKFEPDGEVLMLVVSDVALVIASPPSRRPRARVTGRQALRFKPVVNESPLSSPIADGVAVTAAIYTRELTASPPNEGGARQPDALIAGFE